MLIDDLNQIIGTWTSELEKYNFAQLCAKPTPESWSLGQVYMHLMYDTTFYVYQINTCLSTNDYASEEASEAAKEMFLRNEFPDEVIEGAPDNIHIPQPESAAYLKAGLIKLKNELNVLAKFISTTSFKGKTKHPGLGYFGASEWLQLADMHFRHHLRQKKRIDDFLKNAAKTGQVL